jgi:hypothetical protein
LTVAPLTAAGLGAAPESRAGVASAVNTAVARAAGLIAVAVVPVAAGIGASDYLDPETFTDGYRAGMLIAAVLCAGGGALAALTIRPEGRQPAAAV